MFKFAKSQTFKITIILYIIMVKEFEIFDKDVPQRPPETSTPTIKEERPGFVS